MFFRGSRYDSVPDAEWQAADGRVLRYKRRRLIPETNPPLGTIIRAGDRPDLVAFRVLGSPELFWALCDANSERWPARLTKEAGVTIAVPGPEVGGP